MSVGVELKASCVISVALGKASCLFLPSTCVLESIWSHLLPVLSISSLEDFCQKDLTMWGICPFLDKISWKCYLRCLSLLSHFSHTLQTIIFTYLVTTFTTFTNNLLFAKFSRHLSSHLTLPFLTVPSSLKYPLLWYLQFYILLVLTPVFLATSVFPWMPPSLFIP